MNTRCRWDGWRWWWCSGCWWRSMPWPPRSVQDEDGSPVDEFPLQIRSGGEVSVISGCSVCRLPDPVPRDETIWDGGWDGSYTAEPIWYTRIVAISPAVSNSFVLWNWIRETTYRTPRNRRNLTSGRDLEGELIHRGSIFILLRSGRPRHRSSSTTTASPPSPSIPSTSHIHLVVIPVLVVDLYKYYSFMISSIIIAMMLIASMSE